MEAKSIISRISRYILGAFQCSYTEVGDIHIWLRKKSGNILSYIYIYIKKTFRK